VRFKGADVFWLAVRALAGLEGDRAEAEARLRTEGPGDGRRIDLSNLHLEGANLRNAQLEGAILHLAHLEGSDLHRAHLDHARLGGAHLETLYVNTPSTGLCTH
jgi:uncharacterized protein YjbI with pentapeptide repeats